MKRIAVSLFVAALFVSTIGVASAAPPHRAAPSPYTVCQETTDVVVSDTGTHTFSSQAATVTVHVKLHFIKDFYTGQDCGKGWIEGWGECNSGTCTSISSGSLGMQMLVTNDVVKDSSACSLPAAYNQWQPCNVPLQSGALDTGLKGYYVQGRIFESDYYNTTPWWTTAWVFN